MKVAISGSKGFIGKNLIEKLKNNKIEYIEIDIENGFDITNKNSLLDIPQFDVLCHLAAKVFVPYSYKNPFEFYNTNVVGTLNMLEICRKYNAKMVFMSSYVYGIPQYQPIDELHPIDSFNPYSNTKIIGEQLCKGYFKDYNISSVVLRPFNIFGHGQNPEFLIPLIINQAIDGKIKLKDPRPKRDMLYVDDLIEAIYLAIFYKETPFEIFNIGSGKSFSVLEITKMVEKAINKKIDIEFSGETRQAEVLDTIANINKAKEFLKWNPKVNIEEGLKKLINLQMKK